MSPSITSFRNVSFFFQAEDGIRDIGVTGVQTCALPILRLTEAVVSRELLLRELAAVVAQETGARSVLVAEAGEDGRHGVVACHGWTRAESRSEERRVGKECRSRWSPDHEIKNIID